MGMAAFNRMRRIKAEKAKKEFLNANYTFDQLDAMKIPEIKEILDFKKIEYKSNDTKKDLIANLVEVSKEEQQTPEENLSGELSGINGNDAG